MSAQPNIKIKNGKVYTTSIDVARHFRKRHQHVLEAIENTSNEPKNRLVKPSEMGIIKKFLERNFTPSTYKDSKGETRRKYEITYDGFAFLVMGFTGAKAKVWKIKYINAFNEVEAKLRHQEFHVAKDSQLELFPHFNDEIDKSRPAMTCRFAYEQAVRKGVPCPVPETIKEMIKRGELAGYKSNGVYYVFEESFARYLKQIGE